jgi:hypothetical protein
MKGYKIQASLNATQADSTTVEGAVTAAIKQTFALLVKKSKHPTRPAVSFPLQANYGIFEILKFAIFILVNGSRTKKNWNWSVIPQQEQGMGHLHCTPASI